MKIIVFTLLFLLLTSCSQQYNERVSKSLTYLNDESLNKLTKEHLICFKCETGNYPNSVQALETYKPKTCRHLFQGKPFDFLRPEWSTYKIITSQTKLKDGIDRVRYVFSRQGFEYEQLVAINDPSHFLMNIAITDHPCVP